MKEPEYADKESESGWKDQAMARGVVNETYNGKFRLLVLILHRRVSRSVTVT